MLKMLSATVCIVIPLLAYVFYWYATRTFDYWRKKGVYHIPPVIIFGNIKDRIFFRKSFHEFQKDMYKKFEGHPYAGLYEGRRPVLMVRDPELIKHIMVRDFENFVDRPTLRLRNPAHIQNMLINIKGQHWKNVRSLMTPTFSSGKLKAMKHLVDLCADQMVTYLLELSKKTSNEKDAKCELELKEFFGRFTLDVIASCAFGVQCDSLKDPDAEFVKIAARFNDVSFLDRILIFFVLLFAPKLARFISLSFFNKEAVKFLVDVLKNTKEHRIKNKDKQWNDFLQLMIDAAEQEETENIGPFKDDGTSPKKSNKVLDEDTIIAQSLLFLLAGFETSSTLLTYACYELALNQDVQDKLRAEIQDVLKRHDGQCSYEALQEMHYLEMVLFESLRKHPPVARVDRTCTQPYIIPGTNINLETESSVSIPIMGLHYDPKYYPEPEVFDPDRFSSEEKQKRSPYVFLPFGAGPRNCIGTRFALMSTKIAMVYIIRDFLLTPSPKTEVPFTYSRYSMLLKAQNGIWINVEKIGSIPT